MAGLPQPARTILVHKRPQDKTLAIRRYPRSAITSAWQSRISKHQDSISDPVRTPDDPSQPPPSLQWRVLPLRGIPARRRRERQCIASPSPSTSTSTSTSCTPPANSFAIIGGRPCREYLGVSLCQSVTLTLRKVLANFMRLAQPPADPLPDHCPLKRSTSLACCWRRSRTPLAAERCAPTQDTQRQASWFVSIPILGGSCEPAHHVFPPAGPRAVCRAWQLHSTIAARPRRRSHRVRRLPSTRLLSYSGPFMAQVKRLRHCSTSVSYLRDICCGHEATGGTELSLLRP